MVEKKKSKIKKKFSSGVAHIVSSFNSLTRFVISIEACLQISDAILFPIPNIYVSAMFTFLFVGMFTPEILAIMKSKKNE